MLIGIVPNAATSRKAASDVRPAQRAGAPGSPNATAKCATVTATDGTITAGTITLSRLTRPIRARRWARSSSEDRTGCTPQRTANSVPASRPSRMRQAAVSIASARLSGAVGRGAGLPALRLGVEVGHRGQVGAAGGEVLDDGGVGALGDRRGPPGHHPFVGLDR